MAAEYLHYPGGAEIEQRQAKGATGRGKRGGMHGKMSGGFLAAITCQYR